MADVENPTLNEVPNQAPEAAPTSSFDAPAPLTVDDTPSEPMNPIPDTSLDPMGVTGPDLSVGTYRSEGRNSHIIVLPVEVAPQQRPSRRSVWCNDNCRQACLVLTYPGMVVVSIIGLIMVLVFCVLPTLLFMGMVICAYYCLNPDPLPLSALLRNLLAGEAPSRANSAFYQNSSGSGIQDPEKAKADRALYRTKLIVRRLLKVETVPTRTYGDGSTNVNESNIKVIDHRSKVSKPKPGAELDVDFDANCTDEAWKKFIDKVDLRKHNSRIEIWTDHRVLRFSAPLENPTEDGDSDDDESACKKTPTYSKENRSLSGGDADAPEPVPQYQRSSEIELSSGHLRESNPTLTDRCVRLDCANGVVQSDSDICSTNDEAENTNATLRENSPADSVDDKQEKDNTSSDNDNSPSACSRNTDYFGIEDDERDPGTACDICILEFKVGDEVAWSPNLHCSHAFHKDCILDW